jgi:6-phosphogluconate dehydrogenase
VRALQQTPDLEGIAGVAEDSGEGRWTVQEAIQRGIATPVISAALFARFVSQQEDSIAMKTIAALRNQFGGHAVLPETEDAVTDRAQATTES